jgi:hypothetical protein
MIVSTLGSSADTTDCAHPEGENHEIMRFQIGYERPNGMPLIPGFNGDDIVSVQVNRILPGHHRGLKWSDFPVLKTPVFHDPGDFFISSRKKTNPKMTSDDIRAAMSNQSTFYYDEATKETHFSTKWLVENRFFASKLHKKFAAGKPLLVRFRGQKNFQEVNPKSLADQSAGWHRYHHNYKLNFDAIGCKAIDHVIARYSSLPKPAPLRDDMTYVERMRAEGLPGRQAGYFKYRHNFLTEPVGLQALFALRKATETERSELFQLIVNWPPKRGVGPQMTFGGHVNEGVWTGSGKYKVGIDLQDEIGWAISDGMPLGLVNLEDDGKVSLTDAGNALLDIMHTDNYDPDAFVRFTDPETLTMPGSEIDRIDAWMNRFFHKMKLKVDALR